MVENHLQTAYHPRWLRPHISTYWWIEKPAYLAFILREGSCMFVAWFTAYLLLLLRAVQQGEAAYQAFLTWSATPSIGAVNLVTMAFLTFHAVTFFQAAPQALVVHLGHHRVPARVMLAAHFAAWAVASAVVFWLVVRAR